MVRKAAPAESPLPSLSPSPSPALQTACAAPPPSPALWSTLTAPDSPGVPPDLVVLESSTGRLVLYPERKDAIFSKVKEELDEAPFIASFVGEGRPLRAVCYPAWPNGELVPVNALADYYRQYEWEMPFCFCKIRTGFYHPVRFYIPSGLESQNYGRPSLVCPRGKCPYWIDLPELRARLQQLPWKIYDLRDNPLPASYGITTPTPRSTQSRVGTSETPTKKTIARSPLLRRLMPLKGIDTSNPAAKEETPPPLFPPSSTLEAPKAVVTQTLSDSGTPHSQATLERVDSWPPPPSTQVPRKDVIYITDSSEDSDTFLVDDNERKPNVSARLWQENLEALLAPLKYEDCQALILKILDPESPGLALEDFVRAVAKCPQCNLLMASCLLRDHDCVSRYESPIPVIPVGRPRGPKKRRISLASHSTVAREKAEAAKRAAKGKARASPKGRAATSKANARAGPSSTRI
ncbi:hypothetical protein BC834DRAFT_193040 [Gloeopeniophorella convolvens]|nr:hypothetical protein BC834DRAFT_193040 [Gloeopeniophorella convolvens]